MVRWRQRIRRNHPAAYQTVRYVELVLLGSLLVGALVQWLTTNVSFGLLLVIVLPTYLLVLLVVHLLTGPLAPSWRYKIFLPVVRRVRRSRRPWLRWLLDRVMTPGEHFVTDLILASQDFRGARGEGIYRTVFGDSERRPLIVRREDLERRRWASEEEFSIILLFNDIRLHRHAHGVVLEVDLRSERCAIFNNLGKEFLRSRYLDRRSREKHRRVSAETHAFLLGRNGREADSLTIVVPGMRWASGGYLPIVRWHGRRWACLHFRDIFPVGWNIANGASENRTEYTDLDRLIYRETVEELVLSSALPTPSTHPDRRILRPFGVPDDWLRDPSFAPAIAEHDRLRRQHDEIHFRADYSRVIHPVTAPQSVRVIADDDERRTTEGVLLAINPLELGIEVVRICTFDLEDREFLLDGEVNQAKPHAYLVRQPIGLFDIEVLRKSFQENGRQLGSPLSGREQSQDCRDLGPMPEGSFHVFAEDVALRRRRLDRLRAGGDATADAERKRLERWFEKLDRPVRRAAAEGCLEPPLTWLLPTSWKILEQAFEHRVI